MVDGFKAMSASFVSVGKNGCYLSEIIPQGADQITSTVNALNLQTLDETGRTKDSYSYHLNDTARAYKAANGWYAGSKVITKENDVFFPAGTGFWVSGNASLSLQTAGEVLMDSVQNDLVDGFRLVANPFPVAVKLTGIVPQGVDQITSTVNALNLQTLDETGRTKDSYSYHLNDTARAYKAANGWYAGSKVITAENDVEIPAGGSVWVSGTSNLKLMVVTPFEAE